MNNYIPEEVKDLTNSKQRVMQNVVNELENTSRKSKLKWRYVVIMAVLTMSAMLFVFNEIWLENVQQSATDLQLDLTKPTFFEEQGFLYLNGVTLGDSQSTVIERLGDNYTVDDHEDGSGADFILDYDGIARFYFYQEKLDSIIFLNVDEGYFDKLFNDYNGFKFLTPTTNNDHYFYSKETGQLLKATIIPDGSLYLYLMQGGKDLLENPDFPKIEQIK